MTPTRKIVQIQIKQFFTESLDDDLVNPRPTAAESERLWLLIEKWCVTRRVDDRDELRLAITEVWLTYNPGVELDEWSSDTSRDEDEDEDEDEDDRA